MSRRDVDDTVSRRGRRRATRFCMRTKPYQRRSESSRPQVPAWARSTSRSTVTGWWQVPISGPAVVHEAEQARAEGLVVVHDVEPAPPSPPAPAGPEAERAGLGEPARHHGPHLDQVDPVPELAGPGQAEGVGFPVQVEAGDLDQPDPGVLVQDRPGLAREDGDVVALAGQLPGQEAGVDALATRAGVAPVDEEGDAEALSLAGADAGARLGDRAPGRAYPGRAERWRRPDMWRPAWPPGTGWSS